MTVQTGKKKKEKILLALLPFWTSLIPPLGISCLKSYLQDNGFEVKTVDANMEKGLDEIYNKYFDTLHDYIPQNRRGNFYNIGNDVLRNHMMCHLNYENENHYIQLVKILVYQTFFHKIDVPHVLELNKIIGMFYRRIETYFLDLLEKEKPTVLGLSVYNGTLAASWFIFRLAKEKYPLLTTVMGGGVFADQLALHSPNFDFFLKKTPFIDKIIVGEGELLFLKLLRGELPPHQRVFTLQDINGETLELDTVDIPDYSDMDVRLYPHLSAYISRSCPFQCSFCSETVQWGKYRKKRARQVVEELVKLYKKYGYQLFLMGDSLLNPGIDDLANELLKEDAAIYWDGYLRADKHVCNPENTLLWRRSGFYRARLGLESGSQKILNLMGKGLTTEQIKSALSSLAAAGIKTTTYWVIGHPGESEQDFQQTLAIIEELKDDIYEADCNPFNFYPGGQVNSKKWEEKSIPLYPENAVDMLIARTWVLDGVPSREETYERICRFVDHCKKLDIPNPYSLKDIHQADTRWKRLKKNAAPSLLDFKKKNITINECKQVKRLLTTSHAMRHDGNWGF